MLAESAIVYTTHTAVESSIDRNVIGVDDNNHPASPGENQDQRNEAVEHKRAGRIERQVEGKIDYGKCIGRKDDAADCGRDEALAAR